MYLKEILQTNVKLLFADLFLPLPFNLSPQTTLSFCTGELPTRWFSLTGLLAVSIRGRGTHTLRSALAAKRSPRGGMSGLEGDVA